MTIWNDHSKLFHYTTLSTFEKIWSSQSLWLTYFEDLCDTTEFKIASEYLAKSLPARLLPVIKQLKDEMPLSEWQRHKKQLGSTSQIAKGVAREFVWVFEESLRLQDERDEMGLTRSPAFLISFCSHSNDDKYTIANGLLSQWRAYGHGEGVAIVFDTKRLDKWFRRWAKKNSLQFGSLNPVVYASDSTKFEEDFSDLLENFKSLISDYLFTNEFNLTESDPIIGNYLNCACSVKHQAFAQEREVRLVVLPVGNAHQDKVGKTSDESKQVLECKQSAQGKRYIEVGTEKVRLPIAEIIVGPAHDQPKILERVKDLVSTRPKGKAEIIVRQSQTPPDAPR